MKQGNGKCEHIIPLFEDNKYLSHLVTHAGHCFTAAFLLIVGIAQGFCVPARIK